MKSHLKHRIERGLFLFVARRDPDEGFELIRETLDLFVAMHPSNVGCKPHRSKDGSVVHQIAHYAAKHAEKGIRQYRQVKAFFEYVEEDIIKAEDPDDFLCCEIDSYPAFANQQPIYYFQDTPFISQFYDIGHRSRDLDERIRQVVSSRGLKRHDYFAIQELVSYAYLIGKHDQEHPDDLKLQEIAAEQWRLYGNDLTSGQKTLLRNIARLGVDWFSLDDKVYEPLGFEGDTPPASRTMMSALEKLGVVETGKYVGGKIAKLTNKGLALAYAL